MKTNEWARLLAYVTGLINQQVLLQNEYLAAENRILRAQLPKRLRLTDPQRCTLAEIGKRLGRKALEQVACVAKPETILGWYRRLIGQKFDGSRYRACGRLCCRHLKMVGRATISRFFHDLSLGLIEVAIQP